MECTACGQHRPSTARFCPRCGAPTDAGGRHPRRSGAFAINPAESVGTPIVASVLLPHSSGSRSHTYRFVLFAMLSVSVLATLAGELGFALAAAALTVPVLYALYFLDLNVWDDQPAVVLGAVAVATGAIGAAAAAVLRGPVLGDVAFDAVLTSRVDTRRFLVLGVLWPVVAIGLAQLAPLMLTSRPTFHHLLDGLTFGVLAGSAYVAGDTLVAHRDVFGAGRVAATEDLGSWVPLVLNAALLRPLLFGAMAALAVSEFCGIGPGAGRFSGRYWRALGEVLCVGVVYSYVAVVLETVDGVAGLLLTLLWGALLLLAGVVRLRTRVQAALLEEAADARASGIGPSPAQAARSRCDHCGHGVDGRTDLFCPGCSMAVAANAKPGQRRAASRHRDALDVRDVLDVLDLPVGANTKESSND